MRLHGYAHAFARMRVYLRKRAAFTPWMPRDLERLHKGSSNIPFSLPSSPWPREATVCLVHFVVWAAIGGPFLVILVVVVQIKFFSTQPFEDYFKVVAAQITMTRTPASNWTPRYVDLQNTMKVQCLVCGEDFTKKNLRMLSHLGYIPSTVHETAMSNFART
jgi:hypothetical protein